MITRIIKKLLGQEGKRKPAAAPRAEGRRLEVGVDKHGIDPKLVDERAVKVVHTLKEAGYEAYIVGGAVRDLLLGLRPKDFDVATSATPEQTKALFKRAFIIGRRFRIVHVVFGRGREHEVIEVSTFRAYVDASAAEQVEGHEKTSKSELANKTHVVDASGRVLRDNVWGPQHEDAARRDFTINAMYYDPETQIVVDYHHGIQDAKKRVLRMIGDPVTRYREDPVRILRVVRFAAKLGFDIDPHTQAPVREMAALLSNVPPSRMFDEMIKLLQTGHALASLQELRKQHLDRGVFPVLDAAAQGSTPQREAFIRLALEDTDRRVGEGKTVAPSFLLACMLWHDVLAGWQAYQAEGQPAFPALQQAIDDTFNARIGDVSGRGRLAADMREIWLMQPRFDKRSGNGPLAMVEQPRFRAAFDFLRLRATNGEVAADIASWWEEFSLADEEQRRALLIQARSAKPRTSASSAAAADAVEGAGTGDVPAKKRRRRRRKPVDHSGQVDLPLEPPSH